MAINKNHEFEELNGIKCAIVEKNASQARCDFLQNILTFNQYTVIVQPSPPPKPGLATEVIETTVKATETALPAETYTVGVTDVMFNSTNAIFGRLLKTPDGQVVTLAFWKEKEVVAKEDIPYYEIGRAHV